VVVKMRSFIDISFQFCLKYTTKDDQENKKILDIFVGYFTMLQTSQNL
jgi:hypothetical protein